MADTMTATGLSVWLTSHTKQGECLNKHIQTLATETDTTAFPWHLTVLSGVSEEKLQKVFKNTAGIASYVRENYVRADGLDSIPHNPQQVLFARIREDDWLATVRMLYTSACTEHRNDEHHWHSSFRYGTQDNDQFLSLPSLDCFPVPITHIEVWRTEGCVPEWKRLAMFALREVMHEERC